MTPTSSATPEDDRGEPAAEDGQEEPKASGRARRRPIARGKGEGAGRVEKVRVTQQIRLPEKKSSINRRDPLDGAPMIVPVDPPPDQFVDSDATAFDTAVQLENLGPAPLTLAIPDGGPPALLPVASTPDPVADDPDSPLANLADDPATPRILSKHERGLNAALWASQNVDQLRTVFKIVPLSLGAGLILASLYATLQRQANQMEERRPPEGSALIQKAAENDRARALSHEEKLSERRAHARDSLVRIRSSPMHALVSINDAEIGRTPVSIQRPEPGTLRLRVDLEGYKAWEGRLEVSDESDRRYRLAQQSYLAAPTEVSRGDRELYEIMIHLEKSK